MCLRTRKCRCVKDLLSSTKTKRSLTTLLAEGLLNHSADTDVKIVVVFDNEIKGMDIEDEHSHEKADTQIPNQVLASIETCTLKEICVWSPDTDVLLLLLDLVANHRLGALTKLKFLTGKKTKE